MVLYISYRIFSLNLSVSVIKDIKINVLLPTIPVHKTIQIPVVLDLYILQSPTLVPTPPVRLQTIFVFCRRKRKLYSFYSLLTVLNFVDDSPLLMFGRAALLGYNAQGDPKSCVTAYPTCPNDPDQLINYLNNYNGGFFRFFNGKLPQYAPQYAAHLRPPYGQLPPNGQPPPYAQRPPYGQPPPYPQRLPHRLTAGFPQYAPQYQQTRQPEQKFEDGFVVMGFVNRNGNFKSLTACLRST